MIKRVFVTVGENHVIQGFYSVSGNILTMEGAGPDGRKVVWEDGKPITAKLAPGVDPDAVARGLTKKIRKMFLGEKIPGFNDPIAYPHDMSII